MTNDTRGRRNQTVSYRSISYSDPALIWIGFWKDGYKIVPSQKCRCIVAIIDIYINPGPSPMLARALGTVCILFYYITMNDQRAKRVPLFLVSDGEHRANLILFFDTSDIDMALLAVLTPFITPSRLDLGLHCCKFGRSCSPLLDCQQIGRSCIPLLCQCLS